MTVIVCIVVAEGIAIAADSRQASMSASGQLRVDSDYADKIFPLNSSLGVALSGQSFFYTNASDSPINLGLVLSRAYRYLPKTCSVRKAASIIHQRIDDVLKTHNSVVGNSQAGAEFYVVGFDNQSEIGEVYRCQVPGEIILERNTRDAGAVWTGQREVIDRLVLGYDPRLINFLGAGQDSEEIRKALLKQRAKLQLHFSFQTMPLRNAIALATFLVEATINLLQLSDGIVGDPGQFPSCGGQVDVAVITLDQGFQWVRHKSLEIKVG